MNTKLFFLIGFLTVLSTVYGADSDYSFKDDMSRCVEESDNLCEGSSENGGDCELYQGLVNITMSTKITWTVEQKTTFETFVEMCKTEVFAVTTYSNEEKFIQFSAKLEKFSQEYVEIYEMIQTQNISTWSSVSYVQKVTVIKQQTLIQSSMTLDSNDDCPLFDGLIAAAEATGDANCVNDVRELIDTQLIEIIQDTSISFEEKTIQIQQQITQLYATYTTFEAQLSYTQITGFGFFYQFFGCVEMYQQVDTAPSLCEGTFPDILIIQYLQEQLTIYKSQDIKIALQFNQFIQRVNQSFQNITDAHERQVWFTNYVQQWKVLNYEFCSKYILTVQFGEFGSCFDFCSCDGFEGPVIVTKPTEPVKETTLPVELPSSTIETSEATSEVFPSTTFFTEIPSTSSSCACVCE